LKPDEQGTLVLPTRGVAELMEAVLESGSLFRFRAHGTSMAPFLRDGDNLTIAPIANRVPQVGDILAISYPTGKGPGLVVHRVVERKGAGLVLQGDGNGSAPELVLPENILGRVVQVRRNGRLVRLGLGPERRLIGWLSRTRLLWRLVWPLWRKVRRVIK